MNFTFHPHVFLGSSNYFYGMIQVVLIIFVFALALFYLGRQVYRSFQAQDHCATGCGKCQAAEMVKKNS